MFMHTYIMPRIAVVAITSGRRPGAAAAPARRPRCFMNERRPNGPAGLIRGADAGPAGRVAGNRGPQRPREQSAVAGRGPGPAAEWDQFGGDMTGPEQRAVTRRVSAEDRLSGDRWRREAAGCHCSGRTAVLSLPDTADSVTENDRSEYLPNIELGRRVDIMCREKHCFF